MSDTGAGLVVDRIGVGSPCPTRNRALAPLPFHGPGLHSPIALPFEEAQPVNRKSAHVATEGHALSCRAQLPEARARGGHTRVPIPAEAFPKPHALPRGGCPAGSLASRLHAHRARPTRAPPGMPQKPNT
eukprot:scaffold949_cov404-Prasinococcus_capsulatus_cf.AAC.1